MLTSLPPLAASFVGRHEELARITALLADPNCRLLTLLGPGGIGKTSLAIHAAANQVQFADGMFFVDLAPVSSPDLLPSAIAGALQFTFSGVGDLRLQVADYLGRKQVLLVMDNFEHLLAGHEFLTYILQATPHVKLLVTSRERLNIVEEWVLPLEGLSFPHDDTNTPLDSYSAVQLFAQRARQQDADFSLSTHAESVQRICRRVEGMPLGLELAATWLRVISAEQIAAELEKGLALLTTSLRNVPQRHRSLAAVFAHSWELLAPGEQSVLMRLAIFRGGFDLLAATQVAGASLETLAGLCDKSLIRLRPGDRYDLHQLLRQFAEQQLAAAGAAVAARAAHAEYYLRFVAQRDEDVKGRRQRLALFEIQAEWENIRAALLWAAEHAQYALLTRPVLDCLTIAGEMSSRFVDIQLLYKEVEALLGVQPGDQAAVLWDQIAIRYERLNIFAQTGVDRSRAEAILARTRRRGDKYETACALWVLGDRYNGHHDYAVQLARIEECIALWREIGDNYYIAVLLIVVSGHYYESDLVRVAALFHEANRIRRRIGDLYNLCWSVGSLSYFSFLKGSIDEATQLLDESLAISAEVDTLPWFRSSRHAKAAYAFARGDFEAASSGLAVKSRYYDEQTFRVFRNFSDAFRSLLASMRGDYRLAYAIGQESLAFAYPMLVMWVHLSLAAAACGLGENAQAARALQTGLADAMAYSPTFRRMCLPVAAILAARAGRHGWAAELLGLADAGPPEVMGWMHKWPLLQELRQQLAAALGAGAFHKALARGRMLDLDTVTELILEQGAPGAMQAQPSMPPAATQKAASQSLLDPLSPRELDVLRLIAAGYANQDIAAELFISVTTVKKHVNHIFAKLGVVSRAQAIVAAQRLHLA